MNIISILLIAATVSAAPIAVNAATRAEVLDQIEDRIDRREDRIDRQTNNGPRDLIEDRIDRRENRRDRAGLKSPRAIDRHERRSWRRIWRARAND